MTLYTPLDIDAAFAAWGANCGPCALAAILGRPVNDVRAFLDGFEKRRYMNVTEMMAALTAAGATFDTRRGFRHGLPSHGLAFIQWRGPWCEPGKPIATAYRHTHWLAVDGEMVYDLNADASWVKRELWERAMPMLIREEVKGATGEWYVRRGIEVRR